jgi:hypothetical protein
MNWHPHLLFRIFYTSFYTVLNIALLALLLITPTDTIRQALSNDQLYNVFIIAGSYLLALVLAILIYASRLYTNKTVLAAIPKTWIPVEKGDVNKSVRKMVAGSLNRSAVIAWDSRPRITSEPPTIISGQDARDAIVKVQDPEGMGESKKHRSFRHKIPTHQEKEEHTVVIPSHQLVWGEIAHSGWSSPTSPDLSNLQYSTVIQELPHLIEARAVSMASPDPESTSNPPMPDLQAVDILQRPASMGLRDYIGYLISIGVFTSPSSATDFLAAYENARFSTQTLTEPEFRELMKMFAQILRNIHPFNQAILDTLDEDEDVSNDDVLESDTDDDAASRSQSASSIHIPISRSGSEGTIHTAPSRYAGTNTTSPSKSHREFTTAPATPKSKRSRNQAISRSPSFNEFAQTRQPYVGNSGSSSSSLRSSSQGSVIRLSKPTDGGDLPYMLTVPGIR